MRMDYGARLRHALRVDDDALGPFRFRIGMILSAVTAVLLAPFMLHHVLNGRFALAGYIAIAQGVLVVNALVMRTGRNAPIPFWVMVILFIVSICGSIALQGVNSIFWAYPTIFICYFLLQRRLALLLSVALLLATTTVVAWTLQPAVALRVFATLGLTLVMINVVLNVIGELQRALVEQTITDPLTGAFNRRHLDTQLAQLATPGQAPRSQNALLALDIDHFKQINDRLGHSAGDEVLKRLVSTINARKRRGDMLFRTGGEEFVLLLPGSSAADSLRVADEIRQRVERGELLPGQHVTVSIGVAVQEPDRTAQEWLHAADGALYEAKRSGRNRVMGALGSTPATAPLPFDLP